MAKRKLTFEDALQKLETLAAQIEGGKIGLEESIKKYEEGMGLVKHCRDTLTKAERRLHQLQERTDGTLETKPLKGLNDA